MQEAEPTGPDTRTPNAADERIRRRLDELETAASFPGNAVELAAARHRLGHAYRAAQRFGQAIQWFQAAVTASNESHGPMHPATLRYRSSLANCHYAAGHTDQAIEMFRELFEARVSVLGPDHPDTLRSRGSLGNALHVAGRYDEAEALHRRNVGDREDVLGPQHPSTEASRRNLQRAMARNNPQ